VKFISATMRQKLYNRSIQWIVFKREKFQQLKVKKAADLTPKSKEETHIPKKVQKIFPSPKSY
jgi:predicted RNA-binding protein YlxR (DUF448 family)